MDIIADNSEFSLKRLVLSTYATNAYIVICRQTGLSTLIDVPAGARTIFKELKGTQLECILLTHSHIDHFAGLFALRKRISSPLAIHQADNQKWLSLPPDKFLQDKDILTVGRVKIETFYTPGHTPGSMCFKIGKYLLAGDTLFPGGPGRTTAPGAFQQIVNSIIEKILVLPEDTEIYPGHGEFTTLKRAKEEYQTFSSHQHTPGLCGDVLWLTS
jgi:hydroxyacylglutathione hydrolase